MPHTDPPLPEEPLWLLPQATIVIENHTCSAADLDALLEVTDTWAGHQHRHGHVVTAWAHTFRVHGLDTIDVQLDYALNLLEPVAARLTQTGATIEVRINGLTGTRTFARVTPDRVRRAAALGVSLAFQPWNRPA